MSSSRPKRSLPVTGNLATEIFFGPALAGRLRGMPDDLGGSILWKLWRVILRPAWIASVMVGIAFRSSAGS